MICPQCNHKNIDGVSNCEQCQFPFPGEGSLETLLSQYDDEFGGLDDDEEEEEDIIDLELPADGSLMPLRLGSLGEIRDIIQGVIDGIASDEDLRDMIIDFQEEVNEKLEDMDEMVFSPQLYESIKKPLQAVRAAFEAYDKVFGELRLYFEDNDISHLTMGLDMEEQANLRLSHAFNILRETMTSMLGF